jgi:hypothetical protein
VQNYVTINPYNLITYFLQFEKYHCGMSLTKEGFFTQSGKRARTMRARFDINGRAFILIIRMGTHRRPA